MNEWWSWILGGIGVTALFCIGKYRWWGWLMAFCNECLWFAYGMTTKQYGFVFAAMVYGVVNAIHGTQWWKKRHA